MSSTTQKGLGRQTMGDEREEFVAALAELVEGLHDSMGLTARMLARAQRLHQQAVDGARPVRALLREEQRPLIVELMRENRSALEARSHRFRQTGARALQAEGMTAGEIAAEFGVTRQRVSRLIADDAPKEPQQPSP